MAGATGIEETVRYRKGSMKKRGCWETSEAEVSGSECAVGSVKLSLLGTLGTFEIGKQLVISIS